MLKYSHIQVVPITILLIHRFFSVYKSECKEGKTRQCTLSISTITNELEQARNLFHHTITPHVCGGVKGVVLSICRLSVQ